MIYRSPIIIRFLLFVVSIFLFVILGAFAFMYTEKLQFLDAIWLSVMTVTTVGYEVPKNFSDAGKIISIFLMLFGVGTVLYVLTALAFDFFSGNYLKEYKQQIIKKRMKNLKNHIIICGFGRNGRQAARKLILHQQPFIVIDKRGLENRDDEFGNKTIFIEGNAIEDEVLKSAGIENAYGVIACLPSDADNLFIVVTARQLNPDLKIISRASNSNTVAKLKSAGADNVIMPDKIGGEHMASLLVTPDLMEFMDQIVLEGTKEVNLLEIHANKIDKKYLGKAIEELQINEKSGCRVIGYKDQNNKYTINPEDTKIVEPNSCLIVIGQPYQIESLKKIFLDY